MMVEAKGRDGAGWYILEVDEDDKRFLRHWVRYNLAEAAKSTAETLFKGETLCVGYWDGVRWTVFGDTFAT